MTNSSTPKLSYFFIEPSPSLHSQSFLQSLSTAASEFQQISVSVLCPPLIFVSLLLTSPRFPVHIFNFGSVLKIFRTSLKQATIVHFTKIESFLLQILILSCLAFPFSKLVCTIHWIPVTSTSLSNISEFKPFIHYILLKLLSRRVQFFVVHTEECFLYLKSLGIKSILVGYPLEVAQLKLVDKLHHSISAKPQVKDQSKQILFVGDIRLDKGIELVSELSTYLPKQWDLTVVGNAKSLPANFDSYLKALSENSHQFNYKPGFIPDLELISLINSSDVVLLPYTPAHRGASGILGLAALTETPVVASKNRNISEIVDKYSLGLVADFSAQSFILALSSILSESYFHSPSTALFYRDHSSVSYLDAIINLIVKS